MFDKNIKILIYKSAFVWFILYIYLKLFFSNIWPCQVQFDIRKIKSDVSKVGINLFIMFRIQALARDFSSFKTTRPARNPFI